MKKAKCEKCKKYTYVYEHHILPQARFGKDTETVSLCGKCHKEYPQFPGNKESSLEFHYEKFFKWMMGLSIFEDLFIKGDDDRAEARADAKNRYIELKGRALFYDYELSIYFEKIFTWLENYVKEQNELTINFRFGYFNTFFSKYILALFRILESYKFIKNIDVIVNWYHLDDDEDMEKAGKEYEKIVNLSFNYISCEDWYEVHLH